MVAFGDDDQRAGAQSREGVPAGGMDEGAGSPRLRKSGWVSTDWYLAMPEPSE